MKITMIGYTPASINTFGHLIKPLEEKGITVNKVLLHLYGEKIWGVEHRDVEKLTNEEIKKMLEKEIMGARMVLYSLEGGKVDGQIAAICKEKGITSVGNVFTFWEETKEQLMHRFLQGVQPDIVTVTTEKIKELLETEIKSEVLVWGNPHTDRLLKLKESYRVIEKEKGVVSFFSQPCGTGGQEEPMEECKEMIMELEKLKKEGEIKALRVFVHPRENGRWYTERGIKTERVMDFLESMRSEYIVSVSSTMLYEGVVVGAKGYGYSKTFYEDFKNKKTKQCRVKLGKATEKWVKGIIKQINK